MMNLSSEYFSRHKINCLTPVSESVLFFHNPEGDAFICLFSTHSKSISICDECSKDKPYLCMEVFTKDKYTNTLELIDHRHINPETNILESLPFLMRNKSKNYVPFVASSQRDIEKFLWYYIFSNDSSHVKKMKRRFVSYRESIKNKANEDFVSEMVWVARNYPNLLSSYYDSCYSIILINRVYLMFG